MGSCQSLDKPHDHLSHVSLSAQNESSKKQVQMLKAQNKESQKQLSGCPRLSDQNII
jgi:hypothetical protein